MPTSDFIYAESVTPRRLKLSGAPDDYWQVYESGDIPPDGFAFPLPSRWITKSVSPPNPHKRLIVKAYFDCLHFFMALVWFSLWFSPLFLLLSPIAYFQFRKLFLILFDYFGIISPDPLPLPLRLFYRLILFPR